MEHVFQGILVFYVRNIRLAEYYSDRSDIREELAWLGLRAQQVRI